MQLQSLWLWIRFESDVIGGKPIAILIYRATPPSKHSGFVTATENFVENKNKKN